MNKRTALILRIAGIAFLLYFLYRLILGAKTGQYVPMPLIGCALLVLVGPFRILTIRKDFQGSEEDRNKFRKIVIRSVILTIIIVAVFITVTVIIAINSNNNSHQSIDENISSVQENTAADYPPMVMFNDTLYSAASYLADKEDLTMVGKIESCIDFGVPTENNQANDPLVGCEIYTTPSDPECIFVLYNGVYSAYKATE